MELKKIRTYHFKTQKEVAEAINVSQNTYSNYENAKTDPDIDTLIKLADFFQISIDELVGRRFGHVITRSDFTNEQLELLEIIKSLSKEQCLMLNAYAQGLVKGTQERQENIEKFKRGF